jgi:hypothetical protein
MTESVEDLEKSNMELNEKYSKERCKHYVPSEEQRNKILYLAAMTQQQLIKNCIKIEQIKQIS